MRRAWILWSIAGALAAGGCSDGSIRNGMLKITVSRKDGHPKLSIRKVNVVFEGVVSSMRDIPQLGSFEVQVSTPRGTSAAGGQSTTIDGIEVKSEFADGRARVTVSGQ